MRWADGSWYKVGLEGPDDHDCYRRHMQGQFKRGKMNGTGEYHFARGDTYIGDFLDGTVTRTFRPSLLFFLAVCSSPLIFACCR